MISWKEHLLVGLGIGLVAGLALSGVWPHTPLHAVATDRSESIGIATGPLDQDVEAVYLLDFLTGDLKAFVLGKQPGVFSGYFATNVAKDLNVDPQRNPKFVMVTGVVGLRRSGGNRAPAGSSVCYVAEITSGKLAAYAVPWAASMYASGQPQNGALYLIGETRYRTPAGAAPATGATPVGGVK